MVVRALHLQLDGAIGQFFSQPSKPDPPMLSFLVVTGVVCNSHCTCIVIQDREWGIRRVDLEVFQE